MQKASFKPGELLKMSRDPHTRAKAYKIAGVRQKASTTTKHTGSFNGKSNALGHGGRAAQLKARGVPGGVIGAMARRAHAAPGQANYHGKKAKKAHKQPEPIKGDEQMALKSSHRAKHMKRSKGATHVHVHFHGSMRDPSTQGENLEHEEEGKKEFKKARKDTDPKPQGDKLEHREEDKHEFKRKGSTCMKCKGAHKTSEHGKKKSK